MKLKLNKISVNTFVLIVTSINVIGGFLLGLVVTVISLIVPNEEDLGGLGPWSILVFPILNGLLALMTTSFLAWLYNILAGRLGGIVLEFEDIEQN